MTEIISLDDAKAAGLKKYFTGQPCKRGHVAMRTVSKRDCCECKNVSANAAYHSPAGRERHNKRAEKYLASPKGTATALALYTRSNAKPEVKERKASWSRSPKGMAGRKRYDSRDDVKQRRAERQRRLKYDLLPVEYNFMLAGQGFRCATCLTDEPRGKGQWHVDHCHDTGRVRGILCHHCNVGLGHFKDSPELLQAAIEYLCPTQQTLTPPTSETAGQSKRSPPIEPNESKHTNWSAGLL